MQPIFQKVCTAINYRKFDKLTQEEKKSYCRSNKIKKLNFLKLTNFKTYTGNKQHRQKISKNLMI